MNIFNNQATNRTNIFANNKPQQTGSGGTNNIFANNNQVNTNVQNQSQQQQQSTNLFTQQKQGQGQMQQQQQQQLQQQPQPHPQNPTPAQNIPSQPLIKQSLCQKFSFRQILQKVASNTRLSREQIKFVKHGGLDYFKKDLYKQNLFKTVLSKSSNLGFTKNEMIYQGDIPYCLKIDQIFKKVIRNFASVCQTNDMNGYYLVKQELRQSRLYTRFYRPKQGLNNKVFEVNQKFVSEFYHKGTQNNPSVDLNSKSYKDLLNCLIAKYKDQFMSYLKIVDIVCCGEERLDDDKDGEARLEGDKRKTRKVTNTQQLQQQIEKTQPQSRHLKFSDFLQTHILSSLFYYYKEFSLSIYSDDSKIPTDQTSQARKRFGIIKKQIFYMISKMIGRILFIRYTTEMIMERQPLNVVQVVKFIDKDFLVTQRNSLNQPQFQQTFIKDGLNIILGLIPFGAFIRRKELIGIYYQLPQVKDKYVNSLSQKYQKQLLQVLSQLKTPMFMPIKLWALTEIQYMYFDRGHYWNNVWSLAGMQRKKKDPKKYFQIWQDYLKMNLNVVRILDRGKWSYLFALLIMRLGVERVMQSDLMMSVMVEYTKNMVENSVYEFFTMWAVINNLQQKYHTQYTRIQSQITQMVNNQTRQRIVHLSKMVISKYELFVSGRVLQKLFEQSKVDQSYKISTSLLFQRQTRQSYVKQLIEFIDMGEVLEVMAASSSNSQNRQNIFAHDNSMSSRSTLMLKFLIAQIVKHYNIPYFKSKNSSLSKIIQQSLQQIPQNRYAMESFQREIKFLCRMVMAESECGRLSDVEIMLFDQYKVVDKRVVKLSGGYHYNRQQVGEFGGLKVCVFLCMLVAKISSRQVHNVKCLRYIIQSIDTIYSVPSYRQMILFAFAIVFPLQGSGYVFNHYQNILVSGSENLVEQTVEEREIRCSLQRMIGMVTEEWDGLEGEEKRQTGKLRQMVSHHLNHLILYSDSIDTNFPITTAHYTLTNHQPYILYNKITLQLHHWQFQTAYQYLFNYQFVLRPSSWFYTLTKLLKFPHLLPIDIDSIILLIKKMRIPTIQSPSFSAMHEMMYTINQGNVFEQLIDSMKPTVKKQAMRMKIVNRQLTNYQPYQHFKVLQVPTGKYHKHENKFIVQEKNISFTVKEQGSIMKRICMFVRLIEQVLKLRLQSEFTSYPLLTDLQIITQIYTAITDTSHLHRYKIILTQQSQIISQSVNLTAVIVSLLRLYQYRVVLTDGIKKSRNRQILLDNQQSLLLQSIERWAVHELSRQGSFNDDGFMYLFAKSSQQMLACYQSQARFVDSSFFSSTPFTPNDFGFDSGDTSLKSSIFSIIQLLCQHKAGSLAVKCLQNYSYPIQSSQFFHTYNPTMKYLKHDRSKSTIPLLFSYINDILSGDDIPPDNNKLYIKARTIEMLCVVMNQDLYYREIMQNLDKIKGYFLNLLTNEMLNIKGGYPDRPQMAMISVYNKIALFTYQLIKVTQQKHSSILSYIIDNYLVRPSNLLSLLFQRLDDNIIFNNSLSKLRIVKSIQPISNYFMQQRLIRLTLYRATIDIMCKIVIEVVQLLRRFDLDDCLKWLFKLGVVVTERPLQLKADYGLLITDLNLIPLEVITTSKGYEECILTTRLSENVRQFKYCYRTNARRYGGNFLYSLCQMVHRLKIQLEYKLGEKIQTKLERESGWQMAPAEYVQLQVYNIQLVNCLKSLRFSYQSMSKSYFQLMNMLSHLGTQAQNISFQQIDMQLPKLYQKEIMINKYIIKNGFSFYHGMQCLRGLWMNQTLAEKVNRYVVRLEEYVSTNGSDGALYNNQPITINASRSSNNGIYLKSNVFQHFIPTKLTNCTNPDHVITFISKLLQITIDHYYYQQTLKQTENIRPLREMIRKLLYTLKHKKINCTYRVLLTVYDVIITQHERLVAIQKEKVMKRIHDNNNNKGGNHNELQNQNYQLNGHYLKLTRREQKPSRVDYYHQQSLQHPQIQQIIRQHIDIKQQIIQQLRGILYKQLQTQKPSFYLKKLPMYRQQTIRGNNLQSQEKQKQKIIQTIQEQQCRYSRQQLMQSVQLACKLCINVMESIGELRQYEALEETVVIGLGEGDTPVSVGLTRVVNYVMKLFVQNLQQIHNPLSRIVLFNLCNKFYFTHSSVLPEKWPFYSLHINYCDNLLLSHKPQSPTLIPVDEDNDPQLLQKINALDTYCTLAIVNEKMFTKELLTVLVNVVEVDGEFIRRWKAVEGDGINRGKENFGQLPFQDKRVSNSKKYNLRRYHSHSLTIDKLILYKKLLIAMLLCFVEDNWLNPNYSPQTNALFLQVVNFAVIEFSLQRLSPQRNVQFRLRNLVVFQNLQQDQQMISPNLTSSLPSISSLSRHLSLFEFIGFVHQNQLIYTWMMTVKTGLRYSSIMKEIGGYVLEQQQYDQLWNNILGKIDHLYDFYVSYLEVFVQNSNLVCDLIKLYNYVAQQPTYMDQFNGLTLHFDTLQQDYVTTQIVRGIIQYCALVIETVRKSKDIQWKCQRNWQKERNNSIRKCLQLLQKNKTIQAFKQLGLFEQDYPQIQKTLVTEMNNKTNSLQKQSKNKFY